MNELKIHERTVRFPSSWDEFTTGQLLYLAGLLNKGLDMTEVMIKMMMYCTGIRMVDGIRHETGEGYECEILFEGLHVLVESKPLCEAAATFTWLFEEGKLAPRFTWNPFQTIRTQRMTLKGPDDGLTNISFGQYNMALLYWHAMADDMEANIDRFMSVLWKDLQFEPIELGDPGWFEGISMEVKTVCVLWFVGCANFMKDKFPLTFAETASDSLKQTAFDLYQRLVDELAGGDVTRKEEVRSAPLYDALYTVELAIERSKKQKKDGR